MDSRGVAEYIRALVVTNALAEYLPDEQTGKPSTLPTLVHFCFYFGLCFFLIHLLFVPPTERNTFLSYIISFLMSLLLN